MLTTFRMRTLALVAALVLGLPSSARAEDDSLAWRWRSFETWEYVAMPTVAAAAISLRLFVPLGDPNWLGALPGDSSVDEHLGLGSDSTRFHVAGRLADAFYYGSLANAVLEPLLAAGVAGGDWDTARELVLINLEAYSFVSAVLFVSQLGVRRARPKADACRTGDLESCSQDDRRSWPGGHLTIVATNAALSCLHHAHLPLFGGGAPDIAACGFWIAGTAATFVGRMVTRSHHLSDQMSALGLAAIGGFVLPYLLHYAWSEPSGSASARILPHASETELGLGAVGFY
jgi:hypothetical protein